MNIPRNELLKQYAPGIFILPGYERRVEHFPIILRKDTSGDLVSFDGIDYDFIGEPVQIGGVLFASTNMYAPYVGFTTRGDIGCFAMRDHNHVRFLWFLGD